jgi:DNA polymerase-4
MFARAILHLDLDAFFAAVEVRNNTALRGRPLLISGQGGRSVVTSCSYEARRFGIHAGMPLRLARQRCPEATVLSGDWEAYHRESAIITELIDGEGLVFEKASIDEFYVDLTGMDRHLGCWRWSRELRQRILRETGLPLSAGLAVNKLVAKVGAGEAKPNGEQCIETGAERAFLAPLPVRKLPAIGAATAHRLAYMGVRTIRALSLIEPVLLEREFGRPGRELWRRANAIDERPVVPYHDPRSLGSEHTFEEDTIDLLVLQDTLTRLVMQLAFELRHRQRVAACVTVKLRYSDFNTYTRQATIAPTAHDSVLLETVRQLFAKLFTRRQRIRLLGVKLSRLSSGFTQLDLFRDSPEESQLLQAMDGIRRRFGKGAIRRS